MPCSRATPSGSDEQFVSQARGREITFGKCLDAIERIWNREPGRLLDIGTGGGSFPLHRVEARVEGRGLRAESLAVRVGAGELRPADSSRHGVRAELPGTFLRRRHAVGRAGTYARSEDRGSRDPSAVEGRRAARHQLSRHRQLDCARSWAARGCFSSTCTSTTSPARTIRKLLEDAGFEIVRIRPHFQRLALGYILHRATPYVGASGAPGSTACCEASELPTGRCRTGWDRRLSSRANVRQSTETCSSRICSRNFCK